jgi:hypothetical protein
MFSTCLFSFCRKMQSRNNQSRRAQRPERLYYGGKINRSTIHRVTTPGKDRLRKSMHEPAAGTQSRRSELVRAPRLDAIPTARAECAGVLRWPSHHARRCVSDPPATRTTAGSTSLPRSLGFRLKACAIPALLGACVCPGDCDPDDRSCSTPAQRRDRSFRAEHP